MAKLKLGCRICSSRWAVPETKRVGRIDTAYFKAEWKAREYMNIKFDPKRVSFKLNASTGSYLIHLSIVQRHRLTGHRNTSKEWHGRKTNEQLLH